MATTIKASMRGFKKFVRFIEKNGIGSDDLQRIVFEGGKNDKEKKILESYNKQFDSNDMTPLPSSLPKKYSDFYYEAYNNLRTNKQPRVETDTKGQRSSKSEQLARNKEGDPKYKVVPGKGQTSSTAGQPTAGQPQTGAPQTPAYQQGPQDPSAVISGNLADTLNLIPKVEAGKGAIPERQAFADKRNFQRQLGIDSVQGLGNTLASSYNRGAQDTPYGQAGASPLLSKYDQLINTIRPELTGTQRAANAFAPYATQAGSQLGGLAGGMAFGPAGQIGGSLLGSLLGRGAQSGLESMQQRSPEFQGIQQALSGTDPGYFKAGKRGLADLISGEGKGSSMKTLFGLLRKGGSKTRTGRARSYIGGKVGGLGEWIGQPGRADQLRHVLKTGQALAGFGKQIGLGNIAKKYGYGGLAEMLGLLDPQGGGQTGPGGGLSGANIASLSLPSAYQFAVPELQRSNNNWYGRTLSPETSTRGLDQAMYGGLAPLMAQQDIRSSEIGGQQNAANLTRAGISGLTPVQQALNAMREEAVAQDFYNKQRNLGQQADENTQAAKIGAERNVLSRDELNAGLNPSVQTNLQQQVQQPGFPEAAMYVGQQGAKYSGDALGRKLYGGN